MRTLVLAACTVLVGAAGLAAGPAPMREAAAAAAPRPVLVLLDSDPWRMVIGSDAPTFALYDDGTVLYARHPEGEVVSYASAVLDGKAQDALLAAVLGADRRALAKEPARVDLTEADDEPTSRILWWLDGERHEVSAYGRLAKSRKADGPDDRAKASKPLLAAYDALAAFAVPEATPWLPERIEVMLWDFAYAKDAGVAWPRGWPGLDDPTTRTDADGGMVHVFVPATSLAELRALRASARETQPLLLGGKKWAFAYRFPFPGEGAWMR
jgi:hypothetical protein